MDLDGFDHAFMCCIWINLGTSGIVGKSPSWGVTIKHRDFTKENRF
jgi:hypothetical protein